MNAKLMNKNAFVTYKLYGVALVALTSLFLWSGCASTSYTPTPTPLASPSPFATPSDTDDSFLPINPLLRFYLAYDADTDAARAAFYDALRAEGGIDALRALMDASEMDPYLSTCRLSAGRLLYDGAGFSGAADGGEGTIFASGAFRFTFADGGTIYGMFTQDKLGYLELDAGGVFRYMVRMEKAEDAWLVCVDQSSVRSVAQWGQTSSFARFPGDFAPDLPQATPSPTDAASWDEPEEPTVAVDFDAAYWYGFSWEELSADAGLVYTFLTETP